MKTLLRPRRDFQALEKRRKQAAQLFRAGEILAAVARALQVSRQSVSRWYRAWRRGGLEALEAAGRAGRKPKLNRPQLQRADRALRLRRWLTAGTGSDRVCISRPTQAATTRKA